MPNKHLDRWITLIRDAGFDGWLVADFRWNNPLFARLLDLHSGVLTRRAFLWLPAVGRGEPLVMASRVDGHTVAHLDLPVTLYAGYEEMTGVLAGLLPTGGHVAMEYAVHGRLPTVSRVDAGLVELIRSFGVEVVSSGLLISSLEIWDADQRALHDRAARGVDEAREAALRRCGELLAQGEPVTEGLLADLIRRAFVDRGLEPGDPDVAVGPNSADPHYSLDGGEGAAIERDDVLLIDLSSKVRDAGDGPYADSTWMAYTGANPPADLVTAFDAVRNAREAGVAALEETAATGETMAGREVDRLVRETIEEAGLADHLVHRTGHSLGVDHVHGMGTNLDDVEFPDDRPLLPGSGFTIEPGLYWPGRFGVRSEVSAVLLPDRLQITTERQESLTLLYST